MTNKATDQQIPVLDKTTVSSGEKFITPHGHKAIKHGVKSRLEQRGHRPDRKPEWLKVRLPAGSKYQALKANVRGNKLSTVCEESMCPNIGECWSHNTATIMLMGAVCTRACRFCSVDTGNPNGWLDPDEPANAADAVSRMGLKYVVLTSVDRDDIPDGGAGHYAACVTAIRQSNPQTAVEVLTPDFQGNLDHLNHLLDTDIVVFAQNLETVKRLTHPVRDPRASWETTIALLAHAKQYRPEVLTKTSLMVGIGETDNEILETMEALRTIDVDILTLGQYLRPTANHLPVDRYVTPEMFDHYRQVGLSLGFTEVVSGPFVRSSYRAERALMKNNAGIVNRSDT